MAILRGRPLVLALGLLLTPAGLLAQPANPRNLDLAPGVSRVNTLDQNWSDAEARWFYNVPQGSKLVRYRWFLHLEQPDSDKPFRDADHIRSLGYLARTRDRLGNRDGLPIGFVRDGDHLGITCAACHTNQINFEGKVWLIDGAPTLGDVEKLLRRLVEALRATHDNQDKFDRFAARVLGNGAADADRSKLKLELQAALDLRQGYNQRNLPRAGATPFGPGRIDAFGTIMNEVAETMAGVPNNNVPADAPVSYPFLWDTPHHDFVQWNGAAPNRKTSSRLLKRLVGTEHIGALGRNAGEVLGVFGTMDASEAGSLLELKGYPSSIHRDNLIKIEDTLRDLWSPEWPAEFPPIQPELRDQGEALFRDHCKSCHQPIRRDDPLRTVKANLSAVGTDPRMATNFVRRTAKTGHLKGRLVELLTTTPQRFGEEAPVGQMLRHMVQRGILRPDDDLLDFLEAEPAKLKQTLDELYHQVEFNVVGESKVSIGGLDLGKWLGRYSFGAARPAPPGFQVVYKGRPLNGIWATAPYLHNGSVPNLDELLKPAAKRSQAVFKVGSREFDPVKVGFVTDQGADFDPTLPGNSNAGHDYGGREFTDDERRQLIEYLKSL